MLVREPGMESAAKSERTIVVGRSRGCDTNGCEVRKDDCCVELHSDQVLMNDVELLRECNADVTNVS